MMNVDSTHSPFMQKVIQVIRSIPPGNVVSYGQVATYCGVPRAARQVGWTLRHLEGVHMPWWRVVNNEGRISIQGNLHNDKALQKKLLEQEGVQVDDDYTFLLEKYRFKANNEQLKSWGLSESYRESVLIKYSL